MKRILIVDDDKFVGLTLKKLLKSEGYTIKYVENGSRALAELEDFQPHLVLLDFQLPDMTGFDILKLIKTRRDSINVIMITSFGEVRKAVTAMKLGAYDFFTKPFDKLEILSVVNNIFANNIDSSIIHEKRNGVIGESEIIKKTINKIERVSDKDISVFLEGETGTGKELFARMIHQQSNRADKPFITVDCGAIPETLIESELFGHLKGSFTGAVRDKKGKFKLADKGTIFLDEINSLPLSMQPKFLRVLQEKEIQRLGDENPLKIDVRVIAASNKNIMNDVKTGTFREDLFYRVHEFKIDIPPLRDRRNDILLISDNFLKEFSSEYDISISGFSDMAKDKLLNYYWPGNIRELKNVIKSAVLLSDSDIIDADHLILKNIKENESGELSDDEMLLEKYTTKAEITIIRKALKKANYHKAEAAKLLGISRSQFYKKLDKYGLNNSDKDD